VKGVSNDLKSFRTVEKAIEWYYEGRQHASYPKLECRTTELRDIPRSSFVAGAALRTNADVYQDGHEQTPRVECGLYAMSAITMALVERLHDVHSIQIEDISTSGSNTAFAQPGRYSETLSQRRDR
jgi:hypothetical protein